MVMHIFFNPRQDIGVDLAIVCIVGVDEDTADQRRIADDRRMNIAIGW